MNLNEYQKAAMSTCMPSCYNVPYMLFNLQGEVGGLSSKIAKAIRKCQISFDVTDMRFHERYDNQINWTGMLYGDNNANKDEFMDALLGELGDVLWQISGLCSVLGFTLEDVAQHNLAKLASRKRRGVIDGNGDNR